MPKAPPDIRSLARTHTEAAVRVLVGVMNQPKAPHSARVAAASAILDRGWGKPTQPLSGDGDDAQLMITAIKRTIILPEIEANGERLEPLPSNAMARITDESDQESPQADTMSANDD